MLCVAVWLVQLVGERLGLPDCGVLLEGMGQRDSGPASLMSATADIHNQTYIFFRALCIALTRSNHWAATVAQR